MLYAWAAFVLVSSTFVASQRGSFAGSRPIGFPVLENRTTTTADPLGNRFGEDVTTQRLPIEALGDRDLIDRLSKLPTDKQPFWLLNWQALEAQRKKPQTYPQRPSQFSAPFNFQFTDAGLQPTNVVANAVNTNKNVDAGTTNLNTNAVNTIPNPVTPPPATDVMLGNRNQVPLDQDLVNSSNTQKSMSTNTNHHVYTNHQSGYRFQ